jgi:hypothetical protein
LSKYRIGHIASSHGTRPPNRLGVPLLDNTNMMAKISHRDRFGFGQSPVCGAITGFAADSQAAIIGPSQRAAETSVCRNP